MKQGNEYRALHGPGPCRTAYQNYQNLTRARVFLILSFSLPITQLLLQPEHVSGVEWTGSGAGLAQPKMSFGNLLVREAIVCLR